VETKGTKAMAMAKACWLVSSGSGNERDEGDSEGVLAKTSPPLLFRLFFPFSVLSYASSSLSFVFVSTALFLVQLLLKMETWSCY
jgi:hypothetical protein